MEKTWMPTAAGILDIVAGSIGLLCCLFMAMLFGLFSMLMPSNGADVTCLPMAIMAVIFVPIALFVLAAAILAIIGGIYALRRQKWGLALAGSIGALFGITVIGIVAIIFTAISKSEFE